MTGLNSVLLFPPISPAANEGMSRGCQEAAPQGGATGYFNQSKVTSAEVKVSIVLTVPQTAHPEDKHTTNKGDGETKSVYYNKNKLTGARVARRRRHLRVVDPMERDLPSSSGQPFKADCSLRVP